MKTAGVTVPAQNLGNCPSVSVIVPVYNVEPYLCPCIDSIRSQTYSKLEIILVDDGSADGSGIICDRYAEQDSRIKVIHKENKGQSSARNAGLDIASGKYIAFVDADDAIHPRFVEILMGACEGHGCDIAQCDLLEVSEQSSRLPLDAQRTFTFLTRSQAMQELCAGIEYGNYVVPVNKVYRREIFDGIRYPVGRIHEDDFVAHQILWKVRKMAVISQYLYYYLQRPGSTMNSRYSVRRLDVLDAVRECLDFLKENGLETEYLAMMRRYIGLLESSCVSLKEHVGGCEDICDALSEEKQKLEEQFPSVPEVEEEASWEREWGSFCPYPEGAKVALYGAGKRGKAYYRWLCKNCREKSVVGWVDNGWNGIRDAGYPVTPLDSLLSMPCDYVLVAIRNAAVREKIIQDLKCWGIPEEKILAV